MQQSNEARAFSSLSSRFFPVFFFVFFPCIVPLPCLCAATHLSPFLHPTPVTANSQCEGGYIFGLDGTQWAQSGTAKSIQAGEVSALVSGIKGGAGTLGGTGLKLGGEKYMFLGLEGNVARGKKGANSLVVILNNQCVIVATGGDAHQLAVVNKAATDLSARLASSGY
jgi:hypothetical protein